MSFILITGNATLDIVNSVAHYPHEDEELRALAQWSDVGGNAATMARVLAAHRHRCDWVGVVANDSNGKKILSTLKAHQVGVEHAECQVGTSPTSYITVNQQNGSRTIVHYRDLPELTAAAFMKIEVERYDWLHFEGRNVSALGEMLSFARARVVDQPLSLEIEKVREGLEDLIPWVDVVMFSRAYAQAQGFHDAIDFLRHRQAIHGALWMTCTWGEQGAWAIDHNGVIFHEPALATSVVVDTVGAGDVFNAGLVHALATGQTLEQALQYAVRLAGRKVQQRGFQMLGL